MTLCIPMSSSSFQVDSQAHPSRKQEPSGQHVGYSREPNTLKPVSYILGLVWHKFKSYIIVFESGFAEASSQGMDRITFSVGGADEQSAVRSSSLYDDSVSTLFFVDFSLMSKT